VLIWSVGLAVKTLLYPCKDKNTSLILRKRTYREEQLRTPNKTSLIFKRCEDTWLRKKFILKKHSRNLKNVLSQIFGEALVGMKFGS
jgi:phenylalanyl-tRNA synthetase alpha subunit